MLLYYVLLILPLTSAITIKLTKRRLSDPTLRQPESRWNDDKPFVRAVQYRPDKRVKRMVQDTTTRGVTGSTAELIASQSAAASSASTRQRDTPAGTRYTTVPVYVTLSQPVDVMAIETTTSGGGASTVNDLSAIASPLAASSTSAATGDALLSSSTRAFHLFDPSAIDSSVPAETSAITSSTGWTNVVSTTASPTAIPATATVVAAPIATALPVLPADPWVYTIDVKLGPEGKPVPMLVRPSRIPVLTS
jgi:hypothetical protein